MIASNNRLICLLLAVGVAFVACSHSCSSGAVSEAAPRQERQELEQLGLEGQQEFRNIVSAGKLDGMQWPNFADHIASVKEFYEETSYKLAWSQNGKPTRQALELIRILEEAESKGLDSKDYDGRRWPDRLKALQSNSGAQESARIRFDVALTISGARYISDLHLGKVDPENLHKDFDVERQHHDPGAFLRTKVVSAQSVQDALKQVECPYPGYQRDLVALQKYLQMEKQEVPDPLPQVKKPIAPGQTYEGTGKLVRRLQFLGELSASMTVPTDSQIYSKEIAEGVKLFQTHHGLEADGKLGTGTIVEINQPISHRVEQLRLSLERWRWLPHNYPEAPIVVNIPEFKLRAGDVPEKPTFITSVVVGKAMRTQTPVLEEDMKYIVFWPYWNVPPSILRGEMIPKIAKDREYVQRNGYEIVTYDGQVVTDGVVSDDALARLRGGKLTIRQKPGPKNALGLVKFIFPNDNNVYLHSTPAQSLFSRTRRDFSHGCIRVEDPKALAEWVLRSTQGWNKQRVAEALAAGKEQQVNLTRTIPVLIVYATAVTEEDGQVFFFPDIYGHDKTLARLEAKTYGSNN
jgi:murein L,D-transpeptidase YcbB/YkuD